MATHTRNKTPTRKSRNRSGENGREAGREGRQTNKQTNRQQTGNQAYQTTNTGNTHTHANKHKKQQATEANGKNEAKCRHTKYR